MARQPQLSVVVPLYNEEESLPVLYREIVAALADAVDHWEVVFVDDGSSDSTPKIAAEIAKGDPRVVVVRLRRNFGQTPALQAGIDHAKGDVVVSMDGDLQNDPADIPKFLAKLGEGYDIVCGWRKDRKDKLFLRKVPSWAANRLLRAFTGVKIHDSGCSLKAYRGNLIRGADLYSDMHRFIPAITSLAGARVGEIVVNHRARTFGSTKYGLSRTWKVMADLWMIKMVVDFITRPGWWFAILGLPWLVASIAGMAVSLWTYVGSDPAAQPEIVPPAVTALFVFAFFHVIVVGVVSELVLRTGDYSERNVIRAHNVE